MGQGEDEVTAELERAFALYFAELARCRAAGCYLALLHLLVALPDVCATLEDDNGRTSNDRYRDWCARYFNADVKFTAADRYALRCALLHQGKTTPTDLNKHRDSACLDAW